MGKSAWVCEGTESEGGEERNEEEGGWGEGVSVELWVPAPRRIDRSTKQVYHPICGSYPNQNRMLFSHDQDIWQSTSPPKTLDVKSSFPIGVRILQTLPGVFMTAS